MGSGSYTTSSFVSYSTSRGVSFDASTGRLDSKTSHQDIFKSKTIDPALNPKNVIRECCDSDEHPCTKPVILCLDVTGSMGDAALEVAKSINNIMTKLYDEITGIQFMTIGIGDFAYDRCPLQASQFESDIRIVEQMDKIYFEFGGGGNSFESYTAAWKFGLDHTKLDCFDKRGQKGILITMGDERINPYISRDKWYNIVGDSLQADIETKALYEEASKKFDIFHIHVNHHTYGYEDSVESFRQVLPTQHVFDCKVEEVGDTIVNIIKDTIANRVNTVTAGSDIADIAIDTNPTDMVDHTITVPESLVEPSINRNSSGEITW